MVHLNGLPKFARNDFVNQVYRNVVALRERVLREHASCIVGPNSCDILRREFPTSVPLSTAVSILGHAVFDIIGLRARKKMSREKAKCVVAMVQNRFSNFKLSDSGFKHKARHADLPSGDENDSVSTADIPLGNVCAKRPLNAGVVIPGQFGIPLERPYRSFEILEARFLPFYSASGSAIAARRIVRQFVLSQSPNATALTSASPEALVSVDAIKPLDYVPTKCQPSEVFPTSCGRMFLHLRALPWRVLLRPLLFAQGGFIYFIESERKISKMFNQRCALCGYLP